MFSRLPKRFRLAVKVVPFVVALALAKVVVDLTGAAFIELTTLLGSIVAASVFLLGFLLAGTLADYKEGERLPGELAASLEALADECWITVKNKGGEVAFAGLASVVGLVSAIHLWFYREERTRVIMERISGLNDTFLAYEQLTQPNFIVRMKQEQNNVRRIITRIDTVRDTEFVPAAYTIAEIATVIVLLGILFTEIEPLYEALFYVVGLGSFLVYLMLLIRDLDDPFDFGSGGGESADVSIKPIVDLDEKLKGVLAEAEAGAGRGERVP
jgi:hypothetical protein